MGELLDCRILDRLSEPYHHAIDIDTMVLAYFHPVLFANLLTGARLSHSAF